MSNVQENALCVKMCFLSSGSMKENSPSLPLSLLPSLSLPLSLSRRCRLEQRRSSRTGSRSAGREGADPWSVTIPGRSVREHERVQSRRPQDLGDPGPLVREGDPNVRETEKPSCVAEDRRVPVPARRGTFTDVPNPFGARSLPCPLVTTRKG